MSEFSKFNVQIQSALLRLSNLSASGVNKLFMQNVGYIIQRLKGERDSLNQALLEEAAYCEKYEKECEQRGEHERAARHKERKDRLLSKTLK